MKNKLTVVIPTHYPKASGPSTDLLEYVLKDLSDKCPELVNCKHIISYDQHEENDVYYKNLMELQYKMNVNIDIVKSYAEGKDENEKTIKGRLKSFLNGTGKVKTPYILFWEHDWIFIDSIPVSDIIKTMVKNPCMQIVFFNKRQNMITPTDSMLIPKNDLISTLPFLRTSRYSNNPHIAKREFWQEAVPELIQDESEIELQIFNSYRRLINAIGFDRAQALWGAYLYGKMNMSPVVKHLDGNEWKPE